MMAERILEWKEKWAAGRPAGTCRQEGEAAGLGWGRRRCLRRLAIFCETDEIQVVVVVGKHGFRLVAETQEKANIPGCAQHGAGVKFVGIGRGSFNFVDEGLSHSLTLISGTHGKQPDHAYAGYRPEAYGTGDRSPHFCHENMFLSGILLQALDGFRRPAADFVEASIFTERGLLHTKEGGKISFGCWSDLNHDLFPRRGGMSVHLHKGRRMNSQGFYVPLDYGR